MNNFREIATRLVFPLVMGLGLWTTYYFIHLQDFAINKVTFPVVFIALLIIALLERFLPFRLTWNHTDGDVGNDLINLVITQTIIPRLFTPFGYIILAAITARTDIDEIIDLILSNIDLLSFQNFEGLSIRKTFQ